MTIFIIDDNFVTFKYGSAIGYSSNSCLLSVKSIKFLESDLRRVYIEFKWQFFIIDYNYVTFQYGSAIGYSSNCYLL